MYNQFGNMVAHAEADNRQNQGIRRQKRDNIQSTDNMPHASKRVALGTITNQTRVQPLRAAKQAAQNEGHFKSVNAGDENATAKVAGKPFVIPQSSHGGFSIHFDEPVAQQQMQLSKPVTCDPTPALTTLTALLHNQHYPVAPSPDVILIDENTDSPMILDVSDTTSCSSLVVSSSKSERESFYCVPEYSEDIYQYLREAEMKNRPKAHYMKKQPDVTSSMRSILIDWLVEVVEEYKLHRETMFLAVNYIDRFLSQMSVLRGKLQLVGAASMFLASKFEEIYPPDVNEFVYITDDTYTKKQVLRMEHLVLKVLSFDVAVPTANVFCERFLSMMGADSKTESLAMYLLELTLIESDTYLKHLPSVVAASAVCLAFHTLGNESWKQSLYHASAYQPDELEVCIKELLKTHKNATASHPQQALREKYKCSKYHSVSEEVSTAISLPHCFLH